MTPAMKAGIANHVWGVEEIVGLLAAVELGDDMPPKNIDIPGDNPNEMPW